MLWRRAARVQPLRPAQPVPAGESVRLAALNAAWRRDHWVARRRIWWRWTLWGAQRYGVPAAGVVGVLAGLWFAIQTVTGWVETPAPSSQPELALSQPAPTQAPPTPQAAAPVAAPLPPLENTSGVLLKLEPSWRAAASRQTPVSSPASPEAAEIPNPQLISENWLHSKEP